LLKLPSFAKINWNLRILGKRPDGYHEVATVLQTISLCDELSFELRADDRIVLTCDDPEIPVDDSNLIVRAARALSNQRGANIQLIKKIPTRGGLGGGSSNAAITLLALSKLWDLPLGKNPGQIGSQIGADVPFFLTGGTALARGIGTEIEEISDTEKKHLIVVTPNVAVSTAEAYAALKSPSLTTQESLSILASSFAAPSFDDRTQWPLYNDFEGVIFEIEPEIRRAKLALLEAGAQDALLAGSGSSVFGIFTDEAARDQALGNLKGEAGWRIFPCHTISRSEYCQAISTGA
jgi:4-diphosphocytidyl-2-C-methyl-D-erythritol kinase